MNWVGIGLLIGMLSPEMSEIEPFISGVMLMIDLGIELSWTHTDGSRKSDSFAPAISVTYNSVFALRIVMEINADGSVKPFYEQDERFNR